jgi:hypothetical protein
MNEYLLGTPPQLQTGPAQWQCPAPARQLNVLSGSAAAPPSLQHLEDRAVTAAFLRQFTAEHVTEALATRATAAAVGYLEEQIERRKQEIAELEGMGAAAGGWAFMCIAAATITSDESSDSGQKGTLEPGAEIEALDYRVDDGGFARIKFARGRLRRKGWVSLESADGTRLLQSTRADGPPDPIKLVNCRRWLGWLGDDLQSRRAKSFLTARDVHRYIIKVQTDALRCRYCELPGVAHGLDPSTGVHHFGLADHFFSYNWDSPWEAVVDAICTHSDREVAAGKPVPHYWLDNFAINQHERTDQAGALKAQANYGGDDCWRMSAVPCPPCAPCIGKSGWSQCRQCPCSACAARSEDLPDWERVEATRPGEKVPGFDRVIAHTKSTLMLMEPWYSPRAPTRVWCLYEGNATLRHGGVLNAILGEGQEAQLRSSLFQRFSELKSIVGGLDAATADATGEDDKQKIFTKIRQLPGGFDTMNSNVQCALQRWLADVAEKLVYRLNPNRDPLSEAELAQEAREIGERQASKTRLLDQYPRLPPACILAGNLIATVLPAVTIVYNLRGACAQRLHKSVWNKLASDNSVNVVSSMWFSWWVVVWVLAGLVLMVRGLTWRSHQVRRQLRQHALFQSLQRMQRLIEDGEFSVYFCLILFFIAAVAYVTIGWVMAVASYFYVMIVALTIHEMHCKAESAAAMNRAALAVKAGWIRLQLKETEEAIQLFSNAHSDLVDFFGPNSSRRGKYLAAPGYARALCDHRIQQGGAISSGENILIDAIVTDIKNSSKTTRQDSSEHVTERNGPYYLAAMAAAMRKPDEYILELLTKAGEKGYRRPIGSPVGFPETDEEMRSVSFDRGSVEPEWSEFLSRMPATQRGRGFFSRIIDRGDLNTDMPLTHQAWEKLPDAMMPTHLLDGHRR